MLEDILECSVLYYGFTVSKHGLEQGIVFFSINFIGIYFEYTKRHPLEGDSSCVLTSMCIFLTTAPVEIQNNLSSRKGSSQTQDFKGFPGDFVAQQRVRTVEAFLCFCTHGITGGLAKG